MDGGSREAAMFVVTHLITCLTFQQVQAIDWPSLVQKPHQGKQPAGKLPALLKPNEKLATPEGWEAVRRRLHAEWAAILGPSPERSFPLDPKTLGTEELPGFRRTLVSFQAEDGDRIQAALLLPSGVNPSE